MDTCNSLSLKDLNWKDDFDLLGIIWFIVIVLFYSLVATKYLTYTLPAIIPCIIWAAVKICELVTDKETGEFTQSFKKFNYLITLPLGIYYMILHLLQLLIKVLIVNR